MACPSCRKAPPRPTVPPTSVHTPRSTIQRPANPIREKITGLRYVPPTPKR